MCQCMASIYLFCHLLIIFWPPYTIHSKRLSGTILLDHCFCTFLSKVFDLYIKQLTAPKLQISLVLAFTGNHGLQICQQLLKIL